MNNNSILLAFLLLITSTISYAQQAGDLDGDFDANGSVITSITSEFDKGSSMVVQSDGKIVVTGTSGSTGSTDDPLNYSTLRYKTDGSLDNSFGVNGIVTTDLGPQDRANFIALQADGKTVVAGTSNAVTALEAFALVRYNQDGTVDNSFNTFNQDGVLAGPLGRCAAIAIQSDGKIVAVGTTSIDATGDFLVARYNTNGSIDSSFALNGVVTTDVGGDMDVVRAVALQDDGKIVVVGFSQNVLNTDIAVVRYTENGALDNSFSVNGMVTTELNPANDDGRTVLIQPDGKIVVGGMTPVGNIGFALVRYNIDGTLDNSFGTTGKVMTDVDGGEGNSVLLQPDGKIILVGTPEFTVVRYHEDGTIDSGFGIEGQVTSIIGLFSSAKSCSMQADGKILVAGYAFLNTAANNTGFAVARYLSGLTFGLVDFSIQENSLLVYPNPLQEVAVLEYTLTKEETISIDLFNISGNLVQSLVRSEKRIKGEHKEKLDLDASIPSGSYILRLSNGMGNSSVQVVK